MAKATKPILEERVAALEQAVADLKRSLERVTDTRPWTEQIAGTFRGDPIYAEAMHFGRQYRASQYPKLPRKKRKAQT